MATGIARLSDLQIALLQRAANTECNLLTRLTREHPQYKNDFYDVQIEEIRNAMDILSDERNRRNPGTDTETLIVNAVAVLNS